MAALVNLDPLYLAQVAQQTSGASRPANSPTYGGTVRVITGSYTLLGTEAAADTLPLAYLPKGALLLPGLSSIRCLDPGTTLTLDIGTSANTDGYADGMTLSAGADIRFGSTVTTDATSLVPTVLTADTLITATVASANTVTAGVIIYWTLAYSQF